MRPAVASLVKIDASVSPKGGQTSNLDTIREPDDYSNRMNPFGPIGLALFLAAAGPAAGARSPLADAAEKSDRATVRALLKQKVDVNAPQVDGMTALHWAAYQNDLETANLLLKAGASAKAENRYGVTPLSLACQNGNSEFVFSMLEAGADPNTTLRGGETVLMTAARTGTVGPVKALLARGGHQDRF